MRNRHSFFRGLLFITMALALPLLLGAAPAQEVTMAKRALLVIDVQDVYFNGATTLTWPAGSLDNVVLAMNTANEKGIPIVVIQHTSRNPQSAFRSGNPLWDLRPEIRDIPCAVRIEKNYPGSFTGTGLETWLRENSIDTVVIAGYMTQMCCDTTSRQAFHRDFKVEFLSDATGTRAFENEAGSVSAEDLHNAVLVTQASAFAKVMTTAEWIAALP